VAPDLADLMAMTVTAVAPLLIVGPLISAGLVPLALTVGWGLIAGSLIRGPLIESRLTCRPLIGGPLIVGRTIGLGLGERGGRRQGDAGADDDGN
jgi:hypothetical protein